MAFLFMSKFTVVENTGQKFQDGYKHVKHTKACSKLEIKTLYLFGEYYDEPVQT